MPSFSTMGQTIISGSRNQAKEMIPQGRLSLLPGRVTGRELPVEIGPLFLNYKNFGLVCQENIDHKMWGAAQMVVLSVHCDIRPYEKSTYLLVESLDIKIIFKSGSYGIDIGKSSNGLTGINCRSFLKRLEVCILCNVDNGSIHSSVYQEGNFGCLESY